MLRARGAAGSEGLAPHAVSEGRGCSVRVLAILETTVENEVSVANTEAAQGCVHLFIHLLLVCSLLTHLFTD